MRRALRMTSTILTRSANAVSGVVSVSRIKDKKTNEWFLINSNGRYAQNSSFPRSKSTKLKFDRPDGAQKA